MGEPYLIVQWSLACTYIRHTSTVNYMITLDHRPRFCSSVGIWFFDNYPVGSTVKKLPYQREPPSNRLWNSRKSKTFSAYNVCSYTTFFFAACFHLPETELFRPWLGNTTHTLWIGHSARFAMKWNRGAGWWRWWMHFQQSKILLHHHWKKNSEKQRGKKQWNKIGDFVANKLSRMNNRSRGKLKSDREVESEKQMRFSFRYSKNSFLKEGPPPPKSEPARIRLDLFLIFLNL